MNSIYNLSYALFFVTRKLGATANNSFRLLFEEGVNVRYLFE